jgi:hypothetical protein
MAEKKNLALGAEQAFHAFSYVGFCRWSLAAKSKQLIVVVRRAR